MIKILLISSLLGIVYQFNELVRLLLNGLSRITKRKYNISLHTDQHVGTAMAIIGMPIILNYLFTSGQKLSESLFFIAAVLILFYVLCVIIHVLLKQTSHLNYYNGASGIISVGYTLSAIFHPILRTMPWHAGREAKMLGKLALMLAVPVVGGLILRNIFEPDIYQNRFAKAWDVALVVMVGGIFILITTRALKKHFKRSKMPIFGYYRVALGLVVTWILVNNSF